MDNNLLSGSTNQKQLDGWFKEKGDVIMPPVAAIERPKHEYYLNMEAYLKTIKKLSGKEAQEEAEKNLFNAGIIDEKGELTAAYRIENDEK